MFDYFLAKELGYASPRELHVRLWPHERTYWLAYHKILEEDRRSARLGLEPTEEFSPDEMAGAFSSWVTRHNASLGNRQ